MPLGLLLAAVLATRLTDGRPRFSLPVAAVNSSIFAIALVGAWRLAAAYGTREVILLGDAFGGLQAVLLFERKTARTALGPAQLRLVDRILVDVPGPRTAVRLGIAGVLFLHPGHALSDLPRTGSAAQLRLRRRRAEVRGGQSRARQLVAVVGHRRIDDDGRAVGALLAVSRTRGRREGSSRPAGGGRDAGSREGEIDEQAVWQAVSCGADDAAAIGREFWWRTGRMTLSAFVVAVIVFCLAPRFGRIEFELPPLGDLPWQAGSSGPLRIVGFTDRVRLGEIGTMSDDQRMVFEIQLVHNVGAKPYRPRSDLSSAAQ